MPNTRASTSRLVSKRKLREDAATSDSDDFSLNKFTRAQKIDQGTPIVDNLNEAISGVKKVYTQIQSLEQDNKRLQAELREAQKNASGGQRRSLGSGKKASRRQIQSLERKIVTLEAAREKDKRVIEKLREKEVERDAHELTADQADATPNQQTGDPGESAVKLLRRMCDTIDMNTLAEAEECAICMEEMMVEKCYSLPCEHTVCAGCFKRLGDGSSIPLNDPTSVQCPHCRQTYPREECEIITHTAVQQWDLLLEVSREWATIDVGELDVEEDNDDENSFIDDGSVAGAKSPRPPDSPLEAADLEPEISTTFASPIDNGPVSYTNLSSPMKRKRLEELAAQRTVKQRI